MEVETNLGCDRIYAAQGLIKAMKFMGLWQWLSPNQNLKPSLATAVRVLQFVQKFVLHLPLTFIFSGLMFAEAVLVTDMDQASATLYMSFTELVLVAKVLNLWLHSVEANNFIHELAHSPQFALHTVEEVQFWKRSQRRFLNIVHMYFAGSSFVIISAFVGVLFLEEYQMPYPYWLPFDWHTVPRNYWIAYFYNMASMIFTPGLSVLLDMIGCYFMFHVSLLYKILSFRLKKLKDVKVDDINGKFISLFRFHRKIRRITRECEIISSKFVMAQIFLSALILCFSCYRIQKMNITENLGQFLSMLQFLAVMILQIFLPCYYGNEITLNSMHLTTDVYSTNWLEFPVQTRKIIILFMEFLKRPDSIRAGGYFEVGLPIFTKVINNAYSVFALLMNVEK